MMHARYSEFKDYSADEYLCWDQFFLTIVQESSPAVQENVRYIKISTRVLLSSTNDSSVWHQEELKRSVKFYYSLYNNQ